MNLKTTQLPELLGYLSPALAMLLGAWVGAVSDGSDAATALGAMAGFLAALVVVRIAISLVPGLLPVPQPIPISNQSTPFPKEHYHD